MQNLSQIVLVITYSCVLFLAMVVNLAVRPKISTRLTALIALLAAVMGFFFYGYGYACVIDTIPMAVLRTTMSVWFMFVGRNDLSSISAAPLLAAYPGIFLFWVTHLLAIYAFASATFITLGAGAIRFLRQIKARFSSVSVIYGINDDSVSFAKNLAKTVKGSVLMVGDEQSADAYISDIRQFGGIFCGDLGARNADPHFLSAYGIHGGKNRCDVYALDELSFENILFADKMRESLSASGILPSMTSLVLSAEEPLAGKFQNTKEAYGYGEVLGCSAGELSARLLIRTFPPCRYLTYGKDGQALKDFHALIIGFGSTAQNVLCQLIMNAQIEGAAFRVTICDKNLNEISGSFRHRHRNLFDNYDIRFIEHDARSEALYDFIEENALSLRYVVISTGDRKQDQEILQSIQQYLQDLGSDAPVLGCSRQGISFVDAQTMKWTVRSPYTPEILCDKRLDRLAMRLNQAYQKGNGKSISENWARCDYFSRMSCRAAADFLSEYTKVLPEEIQKDLQNPDRDNSGSPAEGSGGASAATDTSTGTSSGASAGTSAGSRALLPGEETAARTEHLRWCAFHYVMGYRPMPEDVYREREARYLSEKKLTGASTLRIGKDDENRYHACITPWEALPALTLREASATGAYRNYQLMDLDNVRTVIACAAKEEEDSTGYE